MREAARTLRVAGEVNRTLVRLADRRIILPDAIVIIADRAALERLGSDIRTPAAFDAATRSIAINPWADYWDDPEAMAKKQLAKGWWSYDWMEGVRP